MQHKWHDIGNGPAATFFRRRQQERTEDYTTKKAADMRSPGNMG